MLLEFPLRAIKRTHAEPTKLPHPESKHSRHCLLVLLPAQRWRKRWGESTKGTQRSGVENRGPIVTMLLLLLLYERGVQLQPDFPAVMAYFKGDIFHQKGRTLIPVWYFMDPTKTRPLKSDNGLVSMTSCSIRQTKERKRGQSQTVKSHCCD